MLICGQQCQWVDEWMDIYIWCSDWPQTPRSVTFLPQKIIKVLLGYDANIYNRMPIIILKFSRNSLYSKSASLIYPFCTRLITKKRKAFHVEK